MEESNTPDHLSSSLTDLMTSLMVIFILLLLAFVTKTAGGNQAVRDLLLKRLQHDLVPQGFSEKNIKKDEKNPDTILVIVPEKLMNFETGQSDLKPEGQEFLRGHIPQFAAVLCATDIGPNIDSIVVEGHTDRQQYKQDSENQNLRLSQERSMQVVSESLGDLNGMATRHACFLEKLSASGRGEQDQESTPEESRRVIFKIRVKANQPELAKVSAR